MDATNYVYAYFAMDCVVNAPWIFVPSFCNY